MLTVQRYREFRRPSSSSVLATGRSCLRLLNERYKPDVVFLPCLVPEGVIAPFRTSRLYYDLNTDLSPDLSSLERLMADANARNPIVVIIDYCGMLLTTGETRDVAHKFNGILVEDCAEAIFCSADYADIALYSLNKFLPSPDGAAILSYCSIDLSPSLSYPTLPKEVIENYCCHLELNGIVARLSPDSSYLKTVIDDSLAYYERYYDYISNNLEPHGASVDFHGERMRFMDKKKGRVERATKYFERLKPMHVVNFDYTPTWAFPIKTANKSETIAKLTRIGVLPASRDNKWRACTERGSFIMQTQLLLPIHEGVESGDIDVICYAVNA